MLEQDRARSSCLQFEHADIVVLTTKPYGNRGKLSCARQPVKAAIRGRQYRCLPAVSHERSRQVTHDIADAADFATRDRAIFRGYENDVPGVDNVVPF